MFSKIQFGLAAGAVALSLGVGMAYAALSGDAAVAARIACMKGHMAGMGVMVPMFKGEKPYDAATVQDTITKIMDAPCANWAEFWPKDSMTSATLKTHALEAIWTDPKGFEAAGNDYYNAEQALLATKDEASFKAAFPAVGKGCGGCHEKFRAPMQ
jgi:cytochrome c556